MQNQPGHALTKTETEYLNPAVVRPCGLASCMKQIKSIWENTRMNPYERADAEVALLKAHVSRNDVIEACRYAKEFSEASNEQITLPDATKAMMEAYYLCASPKAGDDAEMRVKALARHVVGWRKAPLCNAMENWPTKNKFFPSLSEIKEEYDAEVKRDDVEIQQASRIAIEWEKNNATE